MKRLCSILRLLKFDPLIRAFEDFVILDRKKNPNIYTGNLELESTDEEKIFSNAVIHDVGSCEINTWEKK